MVPFGGPRPSSTGQPQPDRAGAWSGPLKLSVVIPCYNERATVATLLDQVRAVDIGEIEKEIVVVDDFSTDGTRDILREQAGRGDISLHFLPRNGARGRRSARGCATRPATSC